MRNTHRQRWVGLPLCCALAVCTSMMFGCSDDDKSATLDGGVDAGDSGTSKHDSGTGTPDSNTSSADANTDLGDGGDVDSDGSADGPDGGVSPADTSSTPADGGTLAALPYEVNFQAASCGSGLPSGWTQQVVEQNGANSANWRCITTPVGQVVEANAFVASSTDDKNAEVWLVSPRLDLTSTTAPKLEFKVDRRFPGLGDLPKSLYDILIATNYDGTNFSTADWARFQAGFDAMTANNPEADDLTDTGALDLTAYAGKTITIGFVYRAGPPSSFNATVLRIGMVKVSEGS